MNKREDKKEITIGQAVKLVHHFFKNRKDMITCLGESPSYGNNVTDILYEVFKEMDKDLAKKFRKYGCGNLDWETEDEDKWFMYNDLYNTSVESCDRDSYF